MYDGSVPAESYWEESASALTRSEGALASEETCDVAIIGGGFTGLSTALHLVRDYGVDVRLLESGHIGWGASGRNGGVCGLAATKLSIHALVKRYGLEQAKRFYNSQLEGISLVGSLAADEGIDCERRGEGIFEVAHQPSRAQGFESYAEDLKNICGVDAAIYSREDFREIGHDSTEQFGAILVKSGFGIHPLKFAVGLGEAAVRWGAKLHPNSKVIEWHRDAGAHYLFTDGGRIKASRVVVATNGYTEDDLHPGFDGVTLPAISNIVTTRVLTAEERARQHWHTENPVCNTRTLVFYYRMLPDGRFLFGARGDLDGHPRSAARMRRWMIRRLGEVFPGWKDIPITHFWRGLVCVTRRLTPCVGRLEDDASVWFGFGYHANGVNTAPWVGMTLAKNIAGSNTRQLDLPAPLAGMSPRFPLPRLRLWALRAAYNYYKYQDWR